MPHYLVEHKNGAWQCMDALAIDAAAHIAAVSTPGGYGSIVSVRALPHPPPICWDPRNCAGKTRCPKATACTE